MLPLILGMALRQLTMHFLTVKKRASSGEILDGGSLGAEAVDIDVVLSLMKQKASSRLGANITWDATAPAGVVVMLDLVHGGPMCARMST